MTSFGEDYYITDDGFKISNFHKEIDLDNTIYYPRRVRHGDTTIILNSKDMWKALNYLVDNAGIGERIDDESLRERDKAKKLERDVKKLKNLVVEMFGTLNYDCDSCDESDRCGHSGICHRKERLRNHIKDFRIEV